MRFGKPAAWSLIVGATIAVAGWAGGSGAPTEWYSIAGLIIVIPLWAVAVRLVIFVVQWLNRRAGSN